MHQVDMAELLINNGADVNFKNKVSTALIPISDRIPLTSSCGNQAIMHDIVNIEIIDDNASHPWLIV